MLTGTPFIRVVLPSEYRASPYNWAVVSDKRGVLYVGNEGYVLEYDGSEWRKIFVGHETSVRALAVDQAGTVFVGALGEIGYLSSDARGMMRYVSLKHLLPKEHGVFTDIWRAVAQGRTVFFFLRNKIFRFEDNSFSVIKGDFLPLFGQLCHGKVYIPVRDRGIGLIRGNGVEILSGTQPFVLANDKINLLPLDNDRLLIVTDNEGIFSYTPGKGAGEIREIKTPAADYIKRHVPYSAILLHDQRYAVGTSSGGVVVMEADGTVCRIIDRSRGLSPSSVMGLHEDAGNTLWVALFDSIAQIDIHSPFGRLGAGEGLNGAAEVVCRHKGRLYVGSSDGVFSCDGRSRSSWEQPRFKPLPDLDSNAFVFFRWRDSLFATTYNRIARIDGEKVMMLHELEDIIISLGRSQRFPGHLFFGRVNGISALRLGDMEQGGGTIRNEEVFGELTYQVRRIDADSHGNLWLSTAANGLVRIRFLDSELAAYRVERYGVKDGLPSEFANRTFFWQGNLYVATVKGFFRGLETSAGAPAGAPELRFVPAIALNEGLGERLPRVLMLVVEDDQALWCGTERGISRLSAKGDGSLIWDHHSFSALAGELNDVYFDSEGIAWISTDEGLFSYNRRQETRTVPLPACLIRRATFGRHRDLFWGTNFDETVLANGFFSRIALIQPQQLIPDVAYRDNSLSLDFSLPYHAMRVPNEYRTLLEGFREEWSDWKPDTKAVFTNLSPGEYCFRVEGRNNRGQISPQGLYRFRISPPWHGTVLANIVKLLLFLSLIFLIFQLNSRRLLKAKKKLEVLVAERTGEVMRQKEEIRLQAEALFKSNQELEKLSVVARETDNAVFILDGDGRILWVNEGFEKMYGEKPEEFISRRGNTIFEVSQNPDIRSIVRRCREKGQTVRYESFFQRRNDALLWTLTTLTPIRDDNGQIAFLIAIDSDVTRIKTAEIELLQQARDLEKANEEARKERRTAEAANRAKSEFLARMSHEIRTPMNGVLGFTEMLLDSHLSEEQREQLQLIYRSGESLISLLNDILDFSKIEAGEMVLDAIDFDPEVLVFDVCELMMPRINPNQVELLCHIDEGVPACVQGDPGRLRQVLVNLMGNAVKFTEKGEIAVHLQVDEETDTRIKLRLSVRDTGIGIAAEHMDSIFELFQQADGSTSRRFGGTGLGLAICRQIAELMDGRVWVESEVGRGSTFYFTAWLGKCSAISPFDSDISDLMGRKILIVDDSERNLDIMEYILNRTGVRVLRESDCRRVVPLLLREDKAGDPVALCVVDVHMPEMDGFTLLKEIRRLDPPLGSIPVLAFSSALKERAARYRALGFNGFLPKPVRRSRFLSMLALLLGEVEVKPAPPTPGSLATRHTLVEKGKRSTRILLVEDNPINQRLARYIFEKGGYRISIAADGAEALDFLTRHPNQIDLVFMDIQMPGMDGRETTRRIRSLGFSDLPIIAMTAESMPGDRESCLQAGMNDYISKPVKRGVIFEMVRKWVLDRSLLD